MSFKELKERKQRMPKAWVGLDNDTLEKKVYDYTTEILQAFKEDIL